MTPIDYYNQQCQNGTIFKDPQQEIAMQLFQQIYVNLMNEYANRNRWYSFIRKPELVKGLYLWGGVGVGKTFMMDCFYQAFPFKQKMRMHFHQFLQMVHQQLTLHQGEKNPLDVIANELAKKTLLLCFDELFVSDITDAMLLGKLFKLLFQRGVCLVTTSNTPPDDLYKNGLQREQFIPAIEAVKEYTTVLHVPTTIDYRLRHLKEAGVFYSPLGEEADQNMEKTFRILAKNNPVTMDPVMLNGRSIPIIKKTKDIIWFEFTDICTVPRSQLDYLTLAKEFNTIFISNIPSIPAEAKDTICLFISLVDVFYDAKVKLVISAAEPVAELYSRGFMTLEYTRTHSRLLEMQSMDYFDDENKV